MESGDCAKFLGTLKEKALLSTLSYERVLELGLESLKSFENERQWEALKSMSRPRLPRSKLASGDSSSVLDFTKISQLPIFRGICLTLSACRERDSANHLFVQTMVCRQEIVPLGKPCPSAQL